MKTHHFRIIWLPIGFGFLLLLGSCADKTVMVGVAGMMLAAASGNAQAVHSIDTAMQEQMAKDNEKAKWADKTSVYCDALIDVAGEDSPYKNISDGDERLQFSMHRTSVACTSYADVMGFYWNLEFRNNTADQTFLIKVYRNPVPYSSDYVGREMEFRDSQEITVRPGGYGQVEIFSSTPGDYAGDNVDYMIQY